jgi:hypothetical protein
MTRIAAELIRKSRIRVLKESGSAPASSPPNRLATTQRWLRGRRIEATTRSRSRSSEGCRNSKPVATVTDGVYLRLFIYFLSTPTVPRLAAWRRQLLSRRERIDLLRWHLVHRFPTHARRR